MFAVTVAIAPAALLSVGFALLTLSSALPGISTDARFVLMSLGAFPWRWAWEGWWFWGPLGLYATGVGIKYRSRVGAVGGVIAVAEVVVLTFLSHNVIS